MKGCVNMNKLVILVMGEHGAGKSTTIRVYLKKILKITIDTHKFSYRTYKGYILSQSIEERKGFADDVKKYSDNDILIIATRPINDKNSLFNITKSKLQKLGFSSEIIEISKDETRSKQEKKDYYQKKANDIFNVIKKTMK